MKGSFITEEVAKNIYRIPVHLPNNPLKELNSYLIRDPERCLLVDTGFRLPECKEALLSGLRELGVGPEDVDICLTHMHADHSGLAADIVGESRRIYVSEVDGRWLEDLPAARKNWFGDETRDTLAGMPREMVKNMGALNPALMFAPSDSGRYDKVRNGDVLRAGGYSLRCIYTPGHTPGHMCLWDERSGLMFTGDHVLFDITPNITAWPSVDDSLGEYLDALRMIREYPVKTALPGHRKTGDFHVRIEELLIHHDNRLAEVDRIVGAEPGLTSYDISGRMKWKIRSANWDEFPAPQKIFAVGECTSHLNYLMIRGVIRREKDEIARVFRYYKI